MEGKSNKKRNPKERKNRTEVGGGGVGQRETK